MRPNGFQLLLVTTAITLGGSACGSDTANAPQQTSDTPKVEQSSPEPMLSDDFLKGEAIVVGGLGLVALVVAFSSGDYDG